MLIGIAAIIAALTSLFKIVVEAYKINPSFAYALLFFAIVIIMGLAYITNKKEESKIDNSIKPNERKNK